MENLINKLSGAVAALPKQIAETSTKVVKKVTQAPAAVGRKIRDTATLGQARPHQEVNRTQVLRAARGSKAPEAPKALKALKAPKAPKPVAKNGSTRPQLTSFSLNTDMLKELSPAQQRAYFARASECSGNSISNLKAGFDKPEAKDGLYYDQKAMRGLQESAGWVKEKVGFAYEYHRGLEGQNKADATTRELEQKQQAHFEARLKGQNPERYERYKTSQQASEAQIQAEHGKEHWHLRAARLDEEKRSRELLAQDPSMLESRLNPEKLARYKKVNDGATESIVEGTRPENWAKTDAEVAQLNREKDVVRNKDGWLKSLSPEKRAEFQNREQSDRVSIMDSALKQHEQLEQGKNLASLGSNAVSKEDGLLAGAADLLTMGGYAASKNAGEDLGKGLVYLEQAKNLKNAGHHTEAHDYSQRGTHLSASGTMNLAMAGASGYGLFKAAQSRLLKHLKPPTTAKATVAAKSGKNISHRMGGGSAVTGNKVASKTAQTFDDMVQMSKNSGVEHTIDVNMVKFERTKKWGLLPEFKEIPTQHHITVHGGDSKFAHGIADSLDNLPEAAYQAVNKVDNIHVGEAKFFKDSAGKVSDDLMGAVDLSTERATMVLNRTSIDRPLSQVKSGFNREFVNAAENTAARNLRKTVWHEVGHVHDKMLGRVSDGSRFVTAEGRSYSKYAAESGALEEEFAEGYAHLLEMRRDALGKGMSEEAFYRQAVQDTGLGARNQVILDEGLYNFKREMGIFDPTRDTRLDILPEDYEFGIDAVF